MLLSRRSFTLASLVAAGLALAGCDIRAGEGDFSVDFAGGRAQDTWSRSYALPAGGRLELVNVNGTITAESSDGSTVEITAERTAKATSDDAAKQLLDRVEMREEAGAERVRVETRPPSMRGLGTVNVTYRVKVPHGVHVDLRTVNGGVRLAGLDGEVSASSTNGGIKGDVGAASRLDARTVNGGVELRLAQPLPDGSRVTLESVNGGVRLAVPEALKADVVARCVNGRVDVSDVGLAVSGEATRRRVEGRLNGGGGARLDLGTTNVGVRLTKA
jgi:hypothetical protein